MNVLLIDGHRDPRGERFIHALAKAYGEGAQSGGHQFKRIVVGELDFPFLRTGEDFQAGTPSQMIRDSQEAIAWANHLAIFFPLWLGDMPALLKVFFEQALRPGFAFRAQGSNRLPQKLLAGKSARIVVAFSS